MPNDHPHLPDLHHAACPVRVHRAYCNAILPQVRGVGAAMNKTDDKFCPDCGHHAFQAEPYGLWCADCQSWIDPAEILTLEQAQPLRVGYDTSARKEQDE